MLREALASNTIGGRAGEESKWKAMAEDVRQAQSSWSRLGPVPGDAGRELSDRFHKACNRFFEQYRRKVPQTEQRRRKPVGAQVTGNSRLRTANPKVTHADRRSQSARIWSWEFRSRELSLVSNLPPHDRVHHLRGRDLILGDGQNVL